MSSTVLIAAFGAIAVAVAGMLLTRIDGWYRALRKPGWQPPDWLFGPVWSVIFVLAAWSAVLGWTHAGDAADRGRVVVLFVANGVLNAAWSALFFTLRRPDWALAEVVLLWLSIVALIVGLAPISALAAWLLVPYLLWVSFASFLTLTIVRLNRPFPTLLAASPR